MKEAQKEDAKKEKIEKLVVVAKQMNSGEIQRITDIVKERLLKKCKILPHIPKNTCQSRNCFLMDSLDVN